VNASKLILKRMGVMNVTPNSFSDGGEIQSRTDFSKRLLKFGSIDAIDVGAESTAPMNHAISWEEEWQRLEPLLDDLLASSVDVSIDTYHPETIQKIATLWKEEKKSSSLIWNDVSGKFDSYVEKYLSMGHEFKYVLCHNLAPTRDLSGKHMDYVQELNTDDFREHLVQYFSKHKHPQVIFDPTLGFSKTYEQNWWILEHFGELQSQVNHSEWLLGFSRKSFLRKKLGIDKVTPEAKDLLDSYHVEVLTEIKKTAKGVLWIRTHRPELT
jgi:dihydropteroate synthase